MSNPRNIDENSWEYVVYSFLTCQKAHDETCLLLGGKLEPWDHTKVDIADRIRIFKLRNSD